MSELKKLTRKSLESAFATQEKRLMAENMKTSVVRERLRALIPMVSSEVNGQAKREINGKIRALVQWIEGNAQFQFVEELDAAGPVVLNTRSNWVVGLFVGIAGLFFGAFLAGYYLNGTWGQ